MLNRSEEELPTISRRHTPPPVGPDGIQYALERSGSASTTRWVRASGRRERALVVRAGLRWSGAALMRVLKAVLNFVRCGGYGISKRVPDRLTSPCR